LLAVPEAARAAPGFDVERATEAYMDLLSPEARRRSDAYFEGGYVLTLVDWAWTLGVAALLLAGGRMRRLADAVRARVRASYLADTVTVAAILLASSLLALPLTIWVGHFREHAYGLSNLSFAGFLGEWAKGLAVGIVMGAPALAAIYVVIRRAPRTWWLWGAALGSAFLVVGVLIAPVFIAPLFNRYEKLEAGSLRDDILSMARAHRIEAEDVYWFDASKQTKRVSANVSGIGATMRISLNDNLLRRSPRESVLAVLGHEMGHYVLGHVRELILKFSLVLLAGFAFVHFGFERVRRRLGSGWRLESLADAAGWPLLSALLATFFLLATPVTNSIIRGDEAEADAFGLAAAGEPDGFAWSAVQLSEYRKMRPGRLEEIVFYDHPSGYDRIHRAMSWKAEHLDELAAREAARSRPAETPTPEDEPSD
ncbi:MAG: M48 family metalloprotease, partial [Thermoanaerobaculia bacterium]